MTLRSRTHRAATVLMLRKGRQSISNSKLGVSRGVQLWEGEKQGAVGCFTGTPGQTAPIPLSASVHSPRMTIFNEEIQVHASHFKSDFRVSTGSPFQTMKIRDHCLSPPPVAFTAFRRNTCIFLSDLYARSLCPFEPPRCGKGRECV